MKFKEKKTTKKSCDDTVQNCEKVKVDLATSACLFADNKKSQVTLAKVFL